MANDISYRKGTKPTNNKPLIDLTGNRYGRLVVLHQGERVGNRIGWVCQCDCGNIKTISGKTLQNGLVKSCGCLRSETSRKKATKHLMCDTRLYDIYSNMKKRCYNSHSDHYKWYGAENKGIYEEWLGKDGFKHFADWALSHGYNDSLTIDRKDNSKGYSPDNCRWVTPKQNSRNKRNNHFITYQDQTKTISEWSEIFNIPDSLLRSRLRIGWDMEKALTTPKKGKRNGNK